MPAKWRAGKLQGMLRSKPALPTVSVQTALPCLDRVLQARGLPPSQGKTPPEQTIPLDRLIAVGRQRGVMLRPESLNWPQLLRATSSAPVLLRLKNGNMIVALRNTEANAVQIVASDPLYEDGRAFLLPEDALTKAWEGEALTVEREQAKTERAVRWVLLVLSLLGFIAGGFFLVRALLAAIGS